MTKLISSLVIAASILVAATSAQAQSPYGHALSDAAKAGFITPGGVFETR
jgi:hypothetical protein